ncbi:MAG TPA: hypothetical protein VKA48_10010, partial [Gammaproteobacteria bacterium]|nr:hypothetical protein [Gammaproteobacteria bacterium]
MMETDPNEALQRVAAQDGSARELEALAANVVRALLDGWQPEVEGLHGHEAARAGYLIELAATSWATDQQGRLQPLIDALARRRGEQPMAATFYPGEPAAQSGHDELAQKWGLLTGARPAELRNMIEQDPLLSGLPCFLDFEASGLRMPDSYPIEVAWSLPHATVEAYLITPV